MNKNSIVVNLFGPPGSGKSTLAAALFADLKCNDLNCELVTEFAKDMTWAQRHHEMRVQPYIFGKQLARIERVMNKVDIIITDSPLLLSLIYTTDEWPTSFISSVIDIFGMYKNCNFLLKRSKKYNSAGRNQTEEESDALYDKIKILLDESNTTFYNLEGTKDILVEQVKQKLPLTNHP